MSIDLRGLSAKELAALISKAKGQQVRIAKRTPIATVRSKISKFAKAEGYTLDELFGTSTKATKKTAKAAGCTPKAPNPRKRLQVIKSYVPRAQICA